MNALTQPVAVEQPLSQRQSDLHSARHVLELTLRFIREQAQPWPASGLNKATDDPYVISKFGDLQIRIEVAAALLERAEHFLAVSDDGAEISVALAEADIASADALLAVSNAELELTGQRTPLPGSFHDPLRWKYQVIGNYRLNGVLPPSYRSAV